MENFSQKQKLNDFFVSCFYSVLSKEERALEAISNGKLTLKEIHVIEAVFKTLAAKDNSFSSVAKRLGVTTGTLTVSFAKLEKKGYLKKERDETDKRVYRIVPTRLAELINDEHTAFHEKMFNDIIDKLTPRETQNLTDSLKLLTDFFNEI